MIDRIGLRAHDYGRQDLHTLLQEIKAHGWQSIQLAFPKAVQDINSAEDITQNHLDIVNKSGLKVSVLGSYVELGLTDEQSRKAEIAKFIKNISIAKAINASCIASETTSFATQPNANAKDALKALYASLNEILPVAQDLGVVVAVEPVYYHTLSSPKLAKQLLKDMQSEYLKIIFDPINVLDKSLLKTQNDLWDECVDAYEDKIAAVHIKGVRFEGEKGIGCSFSQSQADTKYIIGKLQKLPYGFDILREEASKACALEDIAYIKELLCNV